jgi:hypothetical protein
LILFFPPRSSKAAMLEEGVGDHRHERMTVKALPGSALEVIEAEFFFELLVSLLANPSRLDGGRQGEPVRFYRQVADSKYRARPLDPRDFRYKNLSVKQSQRSVKE